MPKHLEKITWTEFDSSNVKAAYYHEPSHMICVRFNNGGLYSYVGPDEEIYMGFVHAPSVGKYLHHVLKAFPYTIWESEDQLLAYLNL